MDGANVFAYMSKQGKSGKRKYVYQNFDTHEYSLDKLDGVEYKESKLVYRFIEWLDKELAMDSELFERFGIKPKWKRI